MRSGDIGDEAARSADDAELPLDLAAVRADDDLIEALSAGLVPPPSGPRDPSDVEGELVALLAGWVADVRPESLLHPPASQPAAVKLITASGGEPAEEDEPLAAVGSPAPVRSLLEYEDAEPVTISRRRTHGTRGYLLRAAAGLVAIALIGSGVIVRSYDAHPGDSLWVVAKVVFPAKSRSVEAATAVSTALNTARVALESGRIDDARAAFQIRAGPARGRRRRRWPPRAGPPARLPHRPAGQPHPRRGRAGGRAQRGRTARHRPGRRHDPVEPRRHPGSRPGAADADGLAQRASLPPPAIPRRRHRGQGAPRPSAGVRRPPWSPPRPATRPCPSRPWSATRPRPTRSPAPPRGPRLPPRPRHRPTRSSTHPSRRRARSRLHRPPRPRTRPPPCSPRPTRPSTTVSPVAGATAPPTRSPTPRPTPRATVRRAAPATRRTAPGAARPTRRPTSRPRTRRAAPRRRRSGELEERRGRRRRPPQAPRSPSTGSPGPLSALSPAWWRAPQAPEDDRSGDDHAACGLAVHGVRQRTPVRPLTTWISRTCLAVPMRSSTNGSTGLSPRSSTSAADSVVVPRSRSLTYTRRWAP